MYFSKTYWGFGVETPLISMELEGSLCTPSISTPNENGIINSIEHTATMM